MVIFIINWSISQYSSYFITLINTIRNSGRKLVLIDNSGQANHNQKISSLVDEYLIHTKDSSLQDLLAHLSKYKNDKPIVMTNSIMNELEPGNSIATQLKCDHILFELLSGLVDENYPINKLTKQNLHKIKKVIIPSRAIEKFFLNYKNKKEIEINVLTPERCYFEKLVSPSKKCIVYSGRLIPHKNIISFIELNAELFVRFGLELLVIGSGEQEEVLKNLMQKLPFISHLTQASPQVVKTKMDESIGVIVPSSQESFSLLAAEALLRGRPVFLQNTGLGHELHGKMPGLFMLDKSLKISEEQFLNYLNFKDFENASNLMKAFIMATSKNILKVLDEIDGEHRVRA